MTGPKSQEMMPNERRCCSAARPTAPAGSRWSQWLAWEEVSVEEITEETAELVTRVAGLDIGKASLVCCVRVPHDALPGRRRQQVRAFATTTGQLLELRD